MRTRAPTAPMTSVIIGWRNWGYICFRCWQLIHTEAHFRFLSPFYLENVVLLTSPTTHPPTQLPLKYSTYSQTIALEQNQFLALKHLHLYTLIYLYLSFSECTSTAYRWNGCLLGAGSHKAELLLLYFNSALLCQFCLFATKLISWQRKQIFLQTISTNL